jgi:hypothetical protein
MLPRSRFLMIFCLIVCALLSLLVALDDGSDSNSPAP